ncbi:uncharacterized protein C6orf47 homolog [Notothenia coriiceps]|uniref:Uncharacterized protein C6orf47 homolog n=1 Tax=Notothenia coriiceps TaxID=8208 RepID=A0A6I9MWA7_9TELE|nr:PREDICTED: uncharacterized protein C6orf47 homolog [Notothenia coriiceps]
MTAVVSRAWGWVRSWGGKSALSENNIEVRGGQEQGVSKQGQRGWTSWIWGGWRSEKSSPAEEFWEAQEKLLPREVEVLSARQQVTNPESRWWNKYLPTSYISWPEKGEPSGLRQRKRDGGTSDGDGEGDFSDYGTPPPSPTPPSSSPFRLFANSWKVDILPEHYDICFNFLRHLFDLFVVGFLWTVSPPTKLILEVFGVQGPLRLWLHGMAMFFVSSVGMAGLLWLIQEYLPQFALIYGIIQALVISVSVRQSVILGGEEEEEEKEEVEEEDKETEEKKDSLECEEKLVSVKDKVKTS